MELTSNSDPRLPPAVSLPGSGYLVPKRRYFHLWSSCTFKCKDFSCASGPGVHTQLCQHYPSPFPLPKAELRVGFLQLLCLYLPCHFGVFLFLFLSFCPSLYRRHSLRSPLFGMKCSVCKYRSICCVCERQSVQALSIPPSSQNLQRQTIEEQPEVKAESLEMVIILGMTQVRIHKFQWIHIFWELLGN